MTNVGDSSTLQNLVSMATPTLHHFPTTHLTTLSMTESAVVYLYQNVIASLRDFYGTFTTSLAPSVILSSVKTSDVVSSTPVTRGVPRGPAVCSLTVVVQTDSA